jgi:hypothetical protein
MNPAISPILKGYEDAYDRRGTFIADILSPDANVSKMDVGSCGDIRPCTVDEEEQSTSSRKTEQYFDYPHVTQQQEWTGKKDISSAIANARTPPGPSGPGGSPSRMN